MSSAKTKGLIRSLNRSQSSTGKARAAERSGGRLREPAACERCGAVFTRRVWRRGSVGSALLDRVRWVVCPACRLAREGQYFGRVLIRGPMSPTQEALVRARIHNVAARAMRTQPERRVVSVERDRDGLEVLTTSQKLAHRIVRELQKLRGGRATYAWSDDNSLFATWAPRRTAANSTE
ncbi:MAG TPA: NMD3-related protein [Candidatus Eisenbacteria bacterium]|nr:NMD3-related protein [Candidatus Eisenbacteria bacterium]